MTPTDPDQSSSPTSTHDPFLELLRNVSVLRVVLLHLVLRPPLIYLPWIQWLYPGMPEIFFVSGWLAGATAARRGNWNVTRRRLRRVVVPYWVYAAFAIGSMWVTDRRSDGSGATLRWGNVAGFIVPLQSPHGSTTRVVLWSHLWFVTVFVWMVLITPLLRASMRRVGLFTLSIPIAVLTLSLVARTLGHRLPPDVGLIGQFGTYFTLGLVGQAGLFRRTKSMFRASRGPVPTQLAHASLDPQIGPPKLWWLVTACAGVGGVLVATVFDPINRLRPRELYSSRLAYSLVGLAWLALALALHEPLTAWMSRHPSRALRACTQRTFTLYLWGLPSDAVGLAVAKHWASKRWFAVPVYVAVSLFTLCVAVCVFGWIEDLSAGRRARLVPTLG